MKTILVIALLFISAAAVAAEGTHPATPSMSQSTKGDGSGSNTAVGQGQKLEDMQAQMVKNLDAALSEMQKKKACVQAATAPEMIMSCVGEPGEHRGRSDP